MLSVVNHLRLTQKLEKGKELGVVISAELLDSTVTGNSTIAGNIARCLAVTPGLEDDRANDREPIKVTGTNVATVCSSFRTDQDGRMQRLRELVDIGTSPEPEDGKKQVMVLLEEFNDVFSIEDGEWRKTDWVEMTIDTGNATPRKQNVHRIPFAVRQEVAHQLHEMQQNGIIKPWASPIVLVRKKDGTLRLYINYRNLNSVTKPDKFPIPRIDDILDQLGESKYFSTLDMASGYWQIKVSEESQEKTAFITQSGLYEFRVMPFGLTNAPEVFQRSMQRVIGGLNPKEGTDFVKVYIDDLVVFSRSLEEHVVHLRQVLSRLRIANLKLKPSKCHFLCQNVEFLGHVITPTGVGPNPKQVVAVKKFPLPQNVSQVQQFLGLMSYYQRFIGQFAKIASPLHELTRKGTEWHWTDGQQIF